MIPVFVYGTLKSDAPLNQVWLGAGARMQTQYAAVRQMGLVDVGDRYPIAISKSDLTSNREYRILGEVWQVPDDVYAALKAMEERAGYQSGGTEVYVYNDENTMLNSPADAADIIVAQLFFMNTSSYGDTMLPRSTLSEMRPESLRRYGLQPNYQEIAMVSWNNNPRRLGARGLDMTGVAIDRFKYHLHHNNIPNRNAQEY